MALSTAEWVFVALSLILVAAVLYMLLRTDYFDSHFDSPKTNIVSWVFFGVMLYLLPLPHPANESQGALTLVYILVLAYVSMKIGRAIGKRRGWEKPEPQPQATR